jgi:DNA sulfur modification protein DndD
VDHPVTALQESARRGLGEKLSEICHQFIGFIIDTEKAGFVESLESIEGEARYITLFRDIPGNQRFIDLLPEDDNLVSKSENGYVCTDKIFFNAFKDVDPEKNG